MSTKGRLFVGCAAIVAALAIVALNQMRTSNPIKPLEAYAVGPPQVERDFTWARTLLYVRLTPGQAKAAIEDRLGPSWKLTAPRNGNFIFEGVSDRLIVLRHPMRRDEVPSGTVTIVEYSRRTLPLPTFVWDGSDYLQERN